MCRCTFIIRSFVIYIYIFIFLVPENDKTKNNTRVRGVVSRVNRITYVFAGAADEIRAFEGGGARDFARVSPTILCKSHAVVGAVYYIPENYYSPRDRQRRRRWRPPVSVGFQFIVGGDRKYDTEEGKRRGKKKGKYTPIYINKFK